MTRVPLSRVVRALVRAGLFVSASEELPDAITSITDDSRSVATGALFVAVRGADRDGHSFLATAAARGASAALLADASASTLPSIVVSDTRRAAAVAAAAYYDEPARALRCVGVTGTNGKTTTVGMLRHLLEEPGAHAASIGTLGVLIGSEGRALDGGSGLTTPGPVELQRVLRALVDAGVRAVAMEASSHALHQHRLDGVEFEAGVFTNFTRDHLDYHGSMEGYFAAKAQLIHLIAPEGTLVLNADDSAWRRLSSNARTVRFGHADDSDVRALEVVYSPRGSQWTLDIRGEKHDVELPLIGDFNIANALAAAAAAWALQLSPETIASRLRAMPQVPGRLELLSELPSVLRDYAHTPDALERALAAVRPFCTGRLIVVFGCGGDRDRGKRPEMGRVAEAGADLVIVTSDNPRTEDPERILDDIEAGMTIGRHERVAERREAIERAIDHARTGDVILLAGKGHETYQVRGTEKFPFDEREIVHDILASRHH